MKIIKYRLMTEVNHGTHDEPNVVQTFNDKEVHCSDEYYETNLIIAKAEAYNGEVTVEEVPDPEPVVTEPTADELIDILLGRNE